MKNMLWLGLFGIIGMGMSGVGQAAPDGAAVPLRVAAADGAQAAAASAVGVVQQVKPEEGKVKISHEPIAALGWPAMTMYFRVKDKAVLEGIAAGDRVRFDLEKGATGLVITRMEKMAK
ncbi:MAG: copper-binding protein [Gammaproteobacteria bacterium]|nr:copper-binding protein [Gammaproteobacteria bacterium]